MDECLEGGKKGDDGSIVKEVGEGLQKGDGGGQVVTIGVDIYGSVREILENLNDGLEFSVLS